MFKAYTHEYSVHNISDEIDYSSMLELLAIVTVEQTDPDSNVHGANMDPPGSCRP